MTHAVLVHLELSSDQFGTEAEREALFALEDEIIAALGNLGEFDGNEFGGGECVFYIYGDNADRMLDAILPVLKASPASRGGYVVKRYGDAGDRGAGQVNIQL